MKRGGNISPHKGVFLGNIKWIDKNLYFKIIFYVRKRTRTSYHGDESHLHGKIPLYTLVPIPLLSIKICRYV